MKHPVKIFFICITFVALLAAQGPLSEKLTLDPSVTSGKLANGLTYYVRSNAKPEKRVSLRLAVKVGSIMEEEDQRGMAHFVEHMGFNGTAHFPKNDLVHYLQSIGVAFGPEINAYTSFDRTVYMLDLPSDKPEILAKGFEIMADWAQGMTFDSNEIAKERGVVVEEWRMRQGAGDRAMRQWLPVLYPDSRYAERWPIGTRESILGSPDQAIRRFYADWYRPDRMALVVVGDMPVIEAEKRVKESMAKLKNGPPVKEPVVQAKGDRGDWAVCTVVEPEFPNHSVTVGGLLPPEVAVTVGDFRREMARDLALEMLQGRFRELAQSSPPPFLGHQIYAGSFGMGQRDVFVMGVDVAETNLMSGLKIVLTERRRVELHGFTASELDRAKKGLMNRLTRRHEERLKTDSTSLAGGYVEHFATGEAEPGIEKEYQLCKALLPGISGEDVQTEYRTLLKAANPNVLLKVIKKTNILIPTEQEILGLVRQVASSTVAPYIESGIPARLVEKVPAPSKIVSKRELPHGITEIILSNGVKVVLKPTAFKSNEILMSAWAPGGLSLIPDSDWLSVQSAPQVIGATGLGAFRRTDLEKFLTGRTVGVGPTLDEHSVGLRGSSSVEELETLLELAYLNLTSPRQDPTDFDSWLTKQKEAMVNAGRDPRTAYVDQVVRRLYQGHPRSPLPLRTAEEMTGIRLDRAISGWKDLTSDASGFTFFFVGSFTVAQIAPLLETWLGGLPTTRKGRSWKDTGLKIGPGPLETTFARGGDPKGMVMAFQEKPARWTPYESHVAWALGNIVQRRLLDKVREDLGGVYTININCRIDPMPRERAVLQLTFPCAPENASKLTKAALAEMERAGTEAISAEDLQKEWEFEKRTIEKEELQNGPWRSRLQMVWTQEGGDLTRITDYGMFIKQVTAENLKRVAKYFKPDQVQVHTWVPETKGTQKNP